MLAPVFVTSVLDLNHSSCKTLRRRLLYHIAAKVANVFALDRRPTAAGVLAVDWSLWLATFCPSPCRLRVRAEETEDGQQMMRQ